jgi:tRNA(Ser,Leu) C12 N-acetylase TAN1
MEGEDERRKLDRITQTLKLLAKELGFCLIMISHTNDDGKTRGSRNITKVANTVIHLERDKTTPIETLRTQIKFIIEKARLPGSTEGPAGFGQYNTETLVLEDGG